MIKEHDQVVITADLPEHDLKAGDVGVVVHIYNDGEAYELEIFALDGRTLDVVTVEASQVRPVKRDDVLHVRERSA
jgi:hypothetical protein